MTLNGHFALKYVLASASNGLSCSGFKTTTVPKLAELRIHCQRQQEAQLLLGDRATRKHAKDSCMPRIAEMDVEITT